MSIMEKIWLTLFLTGIVGFVIGCVSGCENEATRMMNRRGGRRDVDARLARVERLLRVLLRAARLEMDRDVIALRNQEELMATKEQVLQDLADIRTEVTNTRGAADSAIVLLREVLGRVGDAAASATDLDGFRVELGLIMDGTKETEAALKAAVEAPPPPETPATP